jgi:hypothetical protein
LGYEGYVQCTAPSIAQANRNSTEFIRKNAATDSEETQVGTHGRVEWKPGNHPRPEVSMKPLGYSSEVRPGIENTIGIGSPSRGEAGDHALRQIDGYRQPHIDCILTAVRMDEPKRMAFIDLFEPQSNARQFASSLGPIIVVSTQPNAGRIESPFAGLMAGHNCVRPAGRALAFQSLHRE